MPRLSSRIVKLISGAALIAGLAIAPAAKAENLLVHPDDSSPGLLDAERAAPVLNQLMAPIQPFVSGNSGSTTSIQQIGINNYATSGIDGKGSLALIQQSGVNNRAVQAINGSNSAALLVQGGANNSVAQVINGDRDFQLVGVSGSNNQIAYVQHGDDLAGALAIGGSNNTVVAIQTPSSGRYLMPVGINGLSNATVVIGPGKMYVFPKSKR
jgi:hypothetical protein